MALDVRQVLPHRFPFLFVDALVSQDGDDFECVKNVTHNEPFFAGHFPQEPVMPGVLIVEALAQVGAVAVLGMEENRGKLAFFAGIDKFRFRGQVKPGDVLRLEVELLRLKGSVGKGKATAKVDGRTVAEGELMFAVGQG